MALAISRNSVLCMPSRSSSSLKCRFFHFRVNRLTRFRMTQALRVMTNGSATGCLHASHQHRPAKFLFLT